MNNEPVAWMDEHENVIFEKNWAYPIPLYTHPAKEQSKIFNEKGQELILGGDGTRLYKNPPVKELDRELLDKTIIDQQNEIKDLRKNLDIALMIVNKPELTDEEIEIECRKAWGLHDQDQLNLAEVFKFARAILKKAQEK